MKTEGYSNEVSNNGFISYSTYFCLAFIFTPVVILAIMSESTSKTFKDNMYKALIEK